MHVTLTLTIMQKEVFVSYSWSEDSDIINSEHVVDAICKRFSTEDYLLQR